MNRRGVDVSAPLCDAMMCVVTKRRIDPLRTPVGSGLEVITALLMRLSMAISPNLCCPFYLLIDRTDLRLLTEPLEDRTCFQIPSLRVRFRVDPTVQNLH